MVDSLQCLTFRESASADNFFPMQSEADYSTALKALQTNNTYTYHRHIEPTMAKRKHSSAAALAADSPARRRLPPLLRRAWYGLNQAFRRRMPHPKVTPDQFTALRTLSEAAAPGLTQSELTRLMSSDPNTIASLVERMEKAAWVERTEHESDRRAYRLRLKPAGRKKFEQLRDIALELQVQALAALPEERRERFLEDLALVADACREAADKAPK